MNVIIFIVVGVIVTMLFGKIRGYIVKNFAKKAINKFKIPGFNIKAEKKLKENFVSYPDTLNASVGNVLNKNGDEVFQVKKFLKAFKLNSLVLWVKDFLSMFNLRKLMFYALIIGVVYYYGVNKGKLGQPAIIPLSYEEEVHIKLNGTTLHKPPNSRIFEVLDKKGRVIKIISTGDVKELRRKLSPYGFVLEPHFSYGVAITSKKAKQDVGLGLSWLKFFRWRISNWISNNGIWIGTDYKMTDNFGIGIGIGKDWKWESLMGFRGRWDF